MVDQSAPITDSEQDQLWKDIKEKILSQSKKRIFSSSSRSGCQIRKLILIQISFTAAEHVLITF